MAENPTQNQNQNSEIGGATSQSAPQFYETEFTLDLRKGDYVRRIVGKRTVADQTEFILGSFAGGSGFWKHGKVVSSKVLPDGYYAVANNSWKNRHVYYYEAKGGLVREVGEDELAKLLPAIPLKVKVRMLPDAVEYSFEFNAALKDYLKMQGAVWDAEKKVWRAPSFLKMPDGDIELEEAV